ncbi:MAG: twin-arginine translocation signal domain-containing protein [Verrucomicrobiia bacterium]
MRTSLTRRQFLRASAVVAAGLGPWLRAAAQRPPSERVRIAFIGCGGRAQQMMPMFTSIPDVDVVAVSDVLEPRNPRQGTIGIGGWARHRSCRTTPVG